MHCAKIELPAAHATCLYSRFCIAVREPNQFLQRRLVRNQCLVRDRRVVLMHWNSAIGPSLSRRQYPRCASMTSRSSRMHAMALGFGMAAPNCVRSAGHSRVVWPEVRKKSAATTALIADLSKQASWIRSAPLRRPSRTERSHAPLQKLAGALGHGAWLALAAGPGRAGARHGRGHGRACAAQPRRRPIARCVAAAERPGGCASGLDCDHRRCAWPAGRSPRRG